MFQNPEQVLLIASVILFFSIFAGKAGYRFGLPALLLFLGVGMLFGSDGLGIQFSDPNVAQFIGMLALSIILFSGGMDTKVAEVKPIASQGVVLATLGVLATTFITGGFIYWLFGLFGKYVTLTFPESLLLAAVMSSTDSASVFSILRSKGVYLKERLRPTLELESGSNDPMAYMLTLLLIAYIQSGGMNIWEAGLSLVIQLSVGAIAGFLLGRLAVLIINKIDTVKKEEILPAIDTYRKICDFAEIIPCSALRGKNTQDIIPSIFKYLPYGPMFYDEDTVTDQPQRQIAAEIIREKALHALDEEIPHGIAVAIDRMKKRPGRSNIIDIDATIICERNSHKGIIIGKQGAMLKKIGSNARYELERMLEAKVNLKLWVKVTKNWRDSDFLIKNFGYDKKEI